MHFYAKHLISREKIFMREGGYTVYSVQCTLYTVHPLLFGEI